MQSSINLPNLTEFNQNNIFSHHNILMPESLSLGQQTIIEMNKSLNYSEIPALLLGSKQGDQLVNYRYKDNKYIVDRLFKEAILIRGVGRNQEKVIINWNIK